MNKALIITADGSHSVAIPQMGVTYHSTHGAIQESQHVFIKAGLVYQMEKLHMQDTISIFEMGFGTGLNAFLTLLAAQTHQQKIYYETIEPYPLTTSTFEALNYCAQLQRPGMQHFFMQLHECPWNTRIDITPYFSFTKINTALAAYMPASLFDIVYFDAFAPDIQPDLWTSQVFKKIYNSMQQGAVLTTYCSKSIVRKAIAAAGLTVEKIPGPPHKREMVRASV